MPIPAPTRSRIALIPFLCGLAFFCFILVPPLVLDIKARLHPAAYPNYYPPSIVVRIVIAIYLATIFLALKRRWWSTIPLWLLSILMAVIMVAEYNAEPEGNGYTRGLINIFGVVIPVQIAAILRLRPSNITPSDQPHSPDEPPENPPPFPRIS